MAQINDIVISYRGDNTVHVCHDGTSGMLYKLCNCNDIPDEFFDILCSQKNRDRIFTVCEHSETKLFDLLETYIHAYLS